MQDNMTHGKLLDSLTHPPVSDEGSKMSLLTAIRDEISNSETAWASSGVRSRTIIVTDCGARKEMLPSGLQLPRHLRNTKLQVLRGCDLMLAKQEVPRFVCNGYQLYTDPVVFHS